MLRDVWDLVDYARALAVSRLRRRTKRVGGTTELGMALSRTEFRALGAVAFREMVARHPRVRRRHGGAGGGVVDALERALSGEWSDFVRSRRGSTTSSWSSTTTDVDWIGRVRLAARELAGRFASARMR